MQKAKDSSFFRDVYGKGKTSITCDYLMHAAPTMSSPSTCHSTFHCAKYNKAIRDTGLIRNCCTSGRCRVEDIAEENRDLDLEDIFHIAGRLR